MNTRIRRYVGNTTPTLVTTSSASSNNNADIDFPVVLISLFLQWSFLSLFHLPMSSLIDCASCSLSFFYFSSVVVVTRSRILLLGNWFDCILLDKRYNITRIIMNVCLFLLFHSQCDTVTFVSWSGKVGWVWVAWLSEMILKEQPKDRESNSVAVNKKTFRAYQCQRFKGLLSVVYFFFCF